jgi:hypothetical protein
VLTANDPEALLKQFAAYTPASMPKWITPAQA